MDPEFIAFKKFRLAYVNYQGALAMCQEILAQPVLDLGDDPAPYVIDAGANIGVFTLAVKLRYPKARIVCFEPDPVAFDALTRNVIENDLSDVTLLPKALSAVDGDCPWYGELQGRSPDGRGNSTLAAWGERGYTQKSTVPCVRLSTYCNEPVDFLKLDVEGAEGAVLHETASCFGRIRRLDVEVHETRQTFPEHSVANLRRLMLDSGFDVSSEARDMNFALPQKLAAWQAAQSPKQTVLRCRRRG